MNVYIAALYRWLAEHNVTQHNIASLTHAGQSQISEIISGKRGRVTAYDVFARIADGFRIPRERMGLSYYGHDGTWCHRTWTP